MATASTTTATVSSFSLSLLLLIAAAAVLFPASSAHARAFEICRLPPGVEPYLVEVTELVTQPDPAKANDEFTVTVTANSGDAGLGSASAGVYMVTEIRPPGLGFPIVARSTKLVCGGDSPTPCPGNHQEFVVTDTFVLPITTILPGNYGLQLMLFFDGLPLICLRSDIAIALL